jgi:hypothetical protein
MENDRSGHEPVRVPSRDPGSRASHQRTSAGHSAGLDGPVPDAWSGICTVDQQSVNVALVENVCCGFIDCRLLHICWTHVRWVFSA